MRRGAAAWFLVNPVALSVVPSGMHSKNFVGIESLVSVGVGSSERESDDSVIGAPTT